MSGDKLRNEWDVTIMIADKEVSWRYYADECFIQDGCLTLCNWKIDERSDSGLGRYRPVRVWAPGQWRCVVLCGERIVVDE